jgi:hypothetical protein
MQILDRGSSQPAIPSTWIGRAVRVEYMGSEGTSRETSAVLLDTCGLGAVLGIDGGRTIVSWSALLVLELVPD